MSSKEHFIRNLHQARTAHIRWVNTIKLLVSGINVNEKQITLDATASEFGIWFYHEAMLFTIGTSRMVIEDIEELFLTLHDKYMKIYLIYYKKKNLLSGFIGGKSKASEHEIELSVLYYEEIVILSDKIKHKLRILESQLLSLEDETFNRITKYTASPIEKPIHLEIPDHIDNKEEAYFYGTRGR